MPRTRRGLVLFWTALFMLSIALQYAAAAAPKAALATQECESFAIFTSDPTGETNNKNIYSSKAEVWLNGGPASAGGNLTPGTVFYYQTQEPNGTPLSDIRSTTVLADGAHAGRFFVALAPFDTTSNNGGEYKVVVSTEEDLAQGACTKSDNFKVLDLGSLTVAKDVKGAPEGFSDSFDVTIDCGEAGTFERTIEYPEPGSITIHDIPAGAVCTVEEGTLPDPPTDYEWGDPTYTNNGAAIVKDETVTITVNNTLDFIERPGVSIVKSVSLTGTGGWENELTVTTGTTVYYRITITNTGNVPLTDVSLSDNEFNLEECDVPSTLAVDAHYDCDYSAVAETGKLVNTATVSTAETQSAKDDATVNASENPVLSIQKSNNAPEDAQDLPTAKEGDTVTFTLSYSITGAPASDGVIVDFLPKGLTYVEGSATDSANGEFVFAEYDADEHALVWLAEDVTEGGSVTYQVTVDEGAAELEQPLENTACIASAVTDEDDWDDCDDSEVYVAAPPLAETSVPTPPQTDTIGSTSSGPAGSLLLVLLALAGIVLAVVFVAPTPASLRKRMDR